MASQRMRQLHDRYTRGEELSPAEAEELRQWYDAEDQAEAAELTRVDDGLRLHAVREEVASAVSRLADTAREIQTLYAANEQLRQEIDTYRQQLATQPPAHFV